MGNFILERTPDRIGPNIADFCRELQPKAKPIYVPVAPEEGAQERDCFRVVRRKAEAAGGEILYGWNIWVWPSIWLKAEHHAIWKAPDGSLIDITPKQADIETIVFLPDPSRIYDFENNKRVMNVCRALKHDSAIASLFKAEKALFDYEEECTRAGTLEMHVNPATYYGLIAEKDTRLAGLALRYLRRSAPCRCGSGEKFGACHALQFELLLEPKAP